MVSVQNLEEKVMKKLVVCLAVLAVALPAGAADYTGGGGDPSDWADDTNWSADPTGDTANVNGAFTVIGATDEVSSLRIGAGADVTIPAGTTLTTTGGSSGLGWWTGDPSTLVIEGTFDASSHNNNLWLSDNWDSGPSTLIVRGDGVVDAFPMCESEYKSHE